MFQQVCRRPGGNRVTFLIDECAELGALPIARYMNIGRKYNCRLFTFWQAFTGQMAEIYGPEIVKQIISGSALMWLTALRGYETCDVISKLLGTKAIENLSMTDRLQNVPMPEQSFQHGFQSGPLMRHDELQRLCNSQALVLQGANKPALVNKVPYFAHKAFRDLAGKNPYRG